MNYGNYFLHFSIRVSDTLFYVTISSLNINAGCLYTFYIATFGKTSLEKREATT